MNENNENNEQQERQDPTHDSPRRKAMREGLGANIIVVAVKNAKKRYFIPSVDNFFGNIQYDYVMIDNGCNSYLLPFPSDPSALEQYDDPIFSWEILWSRGTGAIHSPALVIHRIDGLNVGKLVLGGRNIMEVPFLRFHLGRDSATSLLENPLLVDSEKQKLRDFLAELGEATAVERRHVLLGQSVLSKLYSLQAGKMFLVLKKGYLPVRDDLVNAWSIIRGLEKPEGFDDLEDEDHDGDWVSSFDDEDMDWGSLYDN